MGFTVAEELSFPRYGISTSGCYVTIRATYAHNKAGAPNVGMMPMPQPLSMNAQSSPYTLYARFYVYASNDADLSPLREDTIILNLEEAPANPITTLYAAIISQQFAGKTITDL